MMMTPLYDFNTTTPFALRTFVKEEGTLARQATDDAADVQFSTHDDARDWRRRRFFLLRVVVVVYYVVFAAASALSNRRRLF
jgi:hypothetical protein